VAGTSIRGARISICRPPSAPAGRHRHDPAFDRVDRIGQAMAFGPPLPRPGRLQQAENRVEAVAARVVDAGDALRLAEHDTQPEWALAAHESLDDLATHAEPLARLPRSVVGLVRSAAG